MRFKFCIIMLLYNFGLIASGDQGSLWNVDNELLKVNDQTVTYLKEQELIRKSSLLECSQRLGNSNLDRAGFKIVRDLLETYWKDMKQSNGVRHELDSITKRHKRKAPFFLGYISSKELREEVLDLNRVIKNSLEEESNSFVPAVTPTAPVMASVVSGSSGHGKDTY